MITDILDASGIADPNEIKVMLAELKLRATEYGPYVKKDYTNFQEVFSGRIQNIHTLHNVYGCAFTLTRDTLGDEQIYFRFAMSRVVPGVLAHLSQEQFKDDPTYKGVIPWTEFVEWCEYLFGSKVIKSEDFHVVTSHRKPKPQVGKIILELEDNDARHRWECIIPEGEIGDVH